MKKILLGFIAIGLLTFVGCEQEDIDTETDTASTSSSIEYGEGATDIDGNTYKSVIIGEQEWMAENLRTAKYNDGTSIPNVTNDTVWTFDTTAAWCIYDNDSQYDSIHGKLYNWYAVETGKLCPTGWHVPTDAEWTVLKDYLTADGHIGSEGKALKATSGWGDGYEGVSGIGTDDYGWKGLPGGGRDSNGDFYSIGGLGGWWSSSQRLTNSAWLRGLGYGDGIVARDSANKGDGFSVRCLRD